MTGGRLQPLPALELLHGERLDLAGSRFVALRQAGPVNGAGGPCVASAWRRAMRAISVLR